MKNILLPAIRSHVGDWSFYAATISFSNVAMLIKAPDELHESKNLSEWIQREAIANHADEISNYILNTEQRFLGALIIGVYDGNPNWAPLNVNFNNNLIEINEAQKNEIEGKLGLLQLSGKERLFAIDGQHRVEGIKKAVKDDEGNKISSDEICALFVSHDPTSKTGIERTRRPFTTVNKKAKKISKASIIALDEDNGFSIVVRELIDRFWLFEDKRKHVAYTSSGAIPATSETVFTSVVGLYELVKDFCPDKTRKYFENQRPTDKELDDFINDFCIYLDYILNKSEEMKSVFITKEHVVSYYRENNRNHLLFRPVGQRVFTKAVQLLISRGLNIKEAVDSLLKSNLWINEKDWEHILWDPINNKMITNKIALAEALLLKLSGSKYRNKASNDKLVQFLKSIQ
ncbi:TPA: DNA sulfur modification protein DndB [Serratia fonticola]